MAPQQDGRQAEDQRPHGAGDRDGEHPRDERSAALDVDLHHRQRRSRRRVPQGSNTRLCGCVWGTYRSLLAVGPLPLLQGIKKSGLEIPKLRIFTYQKLGKFITGCSSDDQLEPRQKCAWFCVHLSSSDQGGGHRLPLPATP